MSLVNMTPWPMNTSSSMMTPSHRKECDEIFAARTDNGAYLNLDERPHTASLTQRASIEINELRMGDDDSSALAHIVDRHDGLYFLCGRGSVEVQTDTGEATSASLESTLGGRGITRFPEGDFTQGTRHMLDLVPFEFRIHRQR